jgi:hypothetical protein
MVYQKKLILALPNYTTMQTSTNPNLYGRGLYSLITLTIVIFSQFNVHSQPDFTWALRAGGITNDACNSIAYDLNGNVIATGSFQGITSFSTGGSTITALGNKDIFLAAFDPDGQLLWAKAIGGTMEDEGTGIAVDLEGNIYLTGFFRNSVNFGTIDNPAILQVPGIFSSSNAFVAKYSSTGELIWVNQLGSDSNAQGQDIEIGFDGNVYLCGTYSGEVNFNTQGSESLLTSINNGADIFMAKYTPEGALIWAKGMGGTATDIPRAIAVDTQNNVFIAGRFDGTADFDPSLASTTFSAQLTDMFIAKYNPDGELIWAHGIGSSSFEEARDLAVDIDGNAFITGNFWGTVDFDSGAPEVLVTSNSESDAFLAKYSPDGECLWAFNVGGNASDEGRGVTVDPAGNAYITGAFAQTVDFDPSPNMNNLVSNGFFDVYVAKYNSLGAYQWGFVVGGTSSCYGNTIEHDNGNSLYVGGQFAVVSEFDPMGDGFSINSFNAAADAFVAKYNSCNSPEQVIIDLICEGESVIIGETTFTESGSYWLFETNDAGCDSVITLHLEVTEINPGINVFNDVITLEQSNAEYLWYECSGEPVLVEGETNQFFIATENGNYQASITIGDCEVFTGCVPVVVTSTDEISALSQITVYPNPSKNEFRINWFGDKPATATLLNIQGQVVSAPIALQPGTALLIQHGLSPGLYLLQVNYLEEMRVVKVVVE